MAKTVTVATYSEDQFFENRPYLETDEAGQTKLELQAPNKPTIMTVIAFENEPTLPPAERAMTWAVVGAPARPRLVGAE